MAHLGGFPPICARHVKNTLNLAQMKNRIKISTLFNIAAGVLLLVWVITIETDYFDCLNYSARDCSLGAIIAENLLLNLLTLAAFVGAIGIRFTGKV